MLPVGRPTLRVRSRIDAAVVVSTLVRTAINAPIVPCLDLDSPIPPTIVPNLDFLATAIVVAFRFASVADRRKPECSDRQSREPNQQCALQREILLYTRCTSVAAVYAKRFIDRRPRRSGAQVEKRIGRWSDRRPTSVASTKGPRTSTVRCPAQR